MRRSCPCSIQAMGGPSRGNSGRLGAMTGRGPGRCHLPWSTAMHPVGVISTPQRSWAIIAASCSAMAMAPGRGCVPPISPVWLVQETARASSRWQRALARSATISFTTSSLPEPGTALRSRLILLKKADDLVGDKAGFLVIDDTALPKKGCHSVGVAPQYASSLGKTANCQSLVSITLASREVPVMVGLRLFLPESWTDDPERMARAHVPKNRQTALTKPEIAIEEIDRVIASGARFGCVLADSGYGSSGPFRQALSERGLLWAVGLSRRQNVYPADVELIFPRRQGRKAP